jgi:hypothetical protein
MPKSKFTTAQNSLLTTYIPEFVKKLDAGISTGDLTQWKQAYSLNLNGLRFSSFIGFYIECELNPLADDCLQVHQLLSSHIHIARLTLAMSLPRTLRRQTRYSSSAPE